MSENYNTETATEGGAVSKKGFISWVDNFWYHYKWHTIIALFFITVFTVGTVQMCSKEKYDIFIMYAGTEEFDRTRSDGDIYSDYQTALLSFESVSEDYDGNGEVSVSFRDLFLLTGEQISEANKNEDTEVNQSLINDNRNIFIENIRYSTYYLCILSEELYTEYRLIDDIEIFDDITEYIHEETDVKMLDKSAVYLSSTAFGQLPAFRDLPDNTVITLRRISAMAEKLDKKEAEDHHSRAAAALENIINYK